MPNNRVRSFNRWGPSDSTTDEILLFIINAAMAYVNLSVERPRINRMHTSILTGHLRVYELLEGHPDVIYNKIRMHADTFRRLSYVMQELGLLESSRFISVHEQLFIFFTIVCQGQTNREAQDHWQLRGETISRWFGVVLDAFYELRTNFIKPPPYNVVQSFITSRANKYRPWFDNCIGAIDGTHVHYIASESDRERYRNRRGTISQNVMAVVSFDMKFTYMVSGWEGSAHDSRVLNHALADPDMGFEEPPAGKFYLADSGYALQEGFLTPYRGQDYHIQEYRRRSAGIRGPQELYNYTHSSLRNCIERTFGVWKARFRILKRMHPYAVSKQDKIPIACAVIHNYIKIACSEDEMLEEYVQDAVPVVEINAEVAEPDSEDDNDPEYVERPIRRRIYRAQMKNVRNDMAAQMWEAYGRRPWVR